MKRQSDRRHLLGRSRRKTRQGDVQRARPNLVPNVVTFGILAFGTTAFAGGAKGIVDPPPGDTLIPVLLLLAVSFFVVGACMWFVGGIFTDRRFTSADPRTRVKLAREALAPVLAILGLLHKGSASPAPAS